METLSDPVAVPPGETSRVPPERRTPEFFVRRSDLSSLLRLAGLLSLRVRRTA